MPLFWLATEDHDFAEVNHAWVFDAAHQPVKLEMRRSAGAQPVGGVALIAPPVRELRTALEGMPFGEEVADAVEETYRAGNTMGHAFSELLRRLLARMGHAAGGPHAAGIPGAGGAGHARRRGGRAGADRGGAGAEPGTAAAGYHAQVHVEEQTSLFFLLEDGPGSTTAPGA